MGWLLSEWKRLRPYFSLLDFGSAPSTRVAWAVRICVLSFRTRQASMDACVEDVSAAVAAVRPR